MNPTNDDSTPQTFPEVPGLEVVELLAQGAHGSVYCARQVEHDRLVALKVLDTRFVDETTRRRFDRERVALGRISDHPAIVPLIDSGYTEAGLPYLILEYAPGGTLAEQLVANGSMDLDAATKMGINLAAAVECSHNAGIIHRDIKPGNILQSAYGDWMLTDFGIAQLADSPNTSTVQVSYAHTAPEIFEGGVPDVAADVYSLASVLATALAGSEPFEVQPDESPISAMRRIVSEPYPDLRKAGVPDDLATLLEAALSKAPMNRPMTARSFAAALNEVRVRHDLAKLPVRMLQEPGSGSTTVVDEVNMIHLASVGESTSDVSTSERSLIPRMVAAFVLIAALFGAGIFGLASVEGAAPEALAAQLFEDDGPARNDGDGPGRDAVDGALQDVAAADGDDNADDPDGEADDNDDDDGPGNNGGGNGNNDGPGNNNGGGGNGNNNGPGNNGGGNGNNDGPGNNNGQGGGN